MSSLHTLHIKSKTAQVSLHFRYTINSLMAFPFEKHFPDNLKTFGLIYLQ